MSSTWEFEGPVEVRDVVMLCVPSLPGEPVELRYGRDSHQSPHKSAREGFELSILCWRADLDQLTPVAWSDLDAQTRATGSCLAKSRWGRCPHRKPRRSSR